MSIRDDLAGAICHRQLPEIQFVSAPTPFLVTFASDIKFIVYILHHSATFGIQSIRMIQFSHHLTQNKLNNRKTIAYLQ